MFDSFWDFKRLIMVSLESFSLDRWSGMGISGGQLQLNALD